MITIYKAERNAQESWRDLVDQAIGALQGAVEQMEAQGKSAAAERATLNVLQARLHKLSPGKGDRNPVRYHCC